MLNMETFNGRLESVSLIFRIFQILQLLLELRNIEVKTKWKKAQTPLYFRLQAFAALRLKNTQVFFTYPTLTLPYLKNSLNLS